MNILHAYWRMDYVENTHLKDNKHLFTDLPKTHNDQSVYILFRNQHSYLVLNIYPYNAGHILAVPYKKVINLSDLNTGEQIDLIDSVNKAQAILLKGLNPDGFNIGWNIGKTAGAGIPDHLHIHIVPRWTGDTNFMPVINHTKILPESLNSLWERLRPIANEFITDIAQKS